jgi:hypothetical protein
MLTINMHRLIRTVGRVTGVVAAAATSIVLTVLALTRSVLTVHADQTGWAEATITPTPDPVGDIDRSNGGGSTWD